MLQNLEHFPKEEALPLVESFMQQLILKDGPGPLAAMLLEHLSSGGRRLRAHLSLAVFRSLNCDIQSVLPWAAACELLHNATLIHDDIQDGDLIRRGQKTLWARHGIAQAINAGDQMLILPFRALCELKASSDLKLLLNEELAQCASRVVQGQTEEFHLKSEIDQPNLWDRYLKVIDCKTAALFGSPVFGALLLAGESPEEAKKAKFVFGRLGRAFQLVDDLVDLKGRKKGRRAGDDLREGKVSSPLVKYLEIRHEKKQDIKTLIHQNRGEKNEEVVQKILWEMDELGLSQLIEVEVQLLLESFQSEISVISGGRLSEIANQICKKILQPLSESKVIYV